MDHNQQVQTHAGITAFDGQPRAGFVSPRLRNRVEIRGELSGRAAGVFSDEAIEFVAQLELEFRDQRRLLLQKRLERQMEFNTGRTPDFLPETRNIRNGYWKIAPPPAELLERKVELIGAPLRESLDLSLHSGADVFIADFEDRFSPSWDNITQGHVVLTEAIESMHEAEQARENIFGTKSSRSALMIRPRGFQSEEHHVLLSGRPISASLFDVGIFLFNNAKRLGEKGSGPYVYLPKIEGFMEARTWNSIFATAENLLGIPFGTVRAAAVIETLPAAFEMNEILYELCDRALGLSVDRWGYVFSMIKKFRHHADHVFPDRSRITSESRLIRALSLLLIQTCHKRGAHAIGDLSLQYLAHSLPEVDPETQMRVRAEALKAVMEGFDGMRIANWQLVPAVRAMFDAHLTGLNQIERTREDLEIGVEELLSSQRGAVTEEGVRSNINLILRYIKSWLMGIGQSDINGILENATTVEVSRALLWQWIHRHNTTLLDGRKVTLELYHACAQEEFDKIDTIIGANEVGRRRLILARRILDRLVTLQTFEEYFTSLAVSHIDASMRGPGSAIPNLINH